MTPPRVAHLVYDLIRGGTEGQCARIAMGLANQGLPHRVAVFHRRGFFLDAVETACGPVYEAAIRHLVRPGTVREVRRLADGLRQERFDLLHAWDADAAIFGQFAAQWAGVKLVTSRRDLGQIYPPYKSWLMRRADRVAARVVANAEAVRSHFIGQGLPGSKIDVLPNLLDVEERDRLAARPCACTNRLIPGRRMVVVNRLDPEKNTGLLMEALPLVRQAISDAVLIVVGDGREMPALRTKAETLGVAAAVCFLGEVTEVPALLGLCEAGALVPKSNEGLSNTILEYMAAGLPALATDCGGNRELVRNGETGRLVTATASAGDVAEAWISLLQDRDGAAAMGRRARSYIEQHHAPAMVLGKFRSFYEQVARG